ncbi:MAG: hypothetical protein P9L94_11450 [Candidatus Hinthialibacter antarcticus]|nr:hypothetical protein [Candidatus Hinthialibacter antarcticus]
MNVVERLRSIVWGLRWPLLFLAAIIIAVALRIPRLGDGHVDEVHTIGRSLNMIYTGDFSPKFYHYPSGGIYLTLGAEMLALASISREVGDPDHTTGNTPLVLLQKEMPNPIQEYRYRTPQPEVFEAFKYKVRYYLMWMVPLQILLLAYLGYRLNLLAPALAASFFMAFSSASRLESTYAAVNTPCGFFFLLVIAAVAWFATQSPPRKVISWLGQMAALGFLCGLAVGFKYNAGVVLLIAWGYGWYALRKTEGESARVEWFCVGAVVSFALLLWAFTLTTPYWMVDFKTFARDLVHSIWHMQVGHGDYNTFEPGLQMGYIVVRCVADQIAWTGVLLSVLAAVYLAASGYLKDDEQKTRIVVIGWTLISCLAFLALMSKQATFWTRNFSIIWPSLFFVCTSLWWLAAQRIAERRGWNIRRTAWIALTTITVICLIKANWLDIVLNPTREWWR